MTKKTRALSGASQDAYFRRVLKAQAKLSAEDRDGLVGRLRRDIAQVRLRKHAPVEAAEPPPPVLPDVRPIAAPFDPFTPNVIVVLRTSGRDAVLGALGGIDSVDELQLLAREQRLSVPASLASAEDLRAAILAAAERRVANRMAAAG